MIFLTGAGGFFGSHLLQRLLQWDEPIRLLVRSKQKFFCAYPHLTGNLQIDFIEIDLSRQPVTPEMLAGADKIVHAAAMVSLSSEQFEQMKRVNVIATESILNAMPANAYLLFLGSVVVYGPTGTTPIDETHPFPDVALSPYEATKRSATSLVRNKIQSGFHCGILHPGIIYGTGAHGSLTRFAQAVTRKRLPIIAGADTLASFVAIDDVVECAVQMLNRHEESELIATGEVSSLQGFLEEIAQQSGGKAPCYNLSAKMLEKVFILPSALFRMFGGTFPLTPTLLRVAQHHWAFQSDKAKNRLGVHFRNNREGIATWLSGGTLH